MQELISIRLDELSRLRDELVEKQKKDLAKIDVRITELKSLSSGASDEIPMEMDLPFELEEQMVLEDTSPLSLPDTQPIVMEPKNIVPPPPVEAATTVKIPSVLQNVVVSNTPPTSAVEASSDKVGQADIEALINGLI